MAAVVHEQSSTFDALNAIRNAEGAGAGHIGELYRFLLSTENTFAERWSTIGADSGIVVEIFQALQLHLQAWNQANALTGIEWELKDDGEGWLGLAGEIEEEEFNVLEEIWQLSENDSMDVETFFRAAEQISQKSKLFTLLHTMEVTRPDGTTKKVWPHIKSVVMQSRPETLTDMGPLKAAARRARFKFSAFVHDLFNVVAINNDWLQLHAHGAAAFIYRFLVKRLHMTPAEAVSIVRMIDLHHVLQLQKLQNIKGNDRVIQPAQMAENFSDMNHGVELLSRLIWFSFVDSGSRLDFRSEHVAAALHLIQLFTEIHEIHDTVAVMNLAALAIEQAALTLEYLHLQIAAANEKTPLYQQLADEIKIFVTKLNDYLAFCTECYAQGALPDTVLA